MYSKIGADGWTLAATVEQIAASGAADPGETFHRDWKDNRFSVRGRRADRPPAEIETIPNDTEFYLSVEGPGNTLVLRTGHEHTAESINRLLGYIERWNDVRVHPAPAQRLAKVEAVLFSAADLVGMSINTGVSKVVINDPEFDRLRMLANQANPVFDRFYLKQGFDHVWPIAPARIFKILSAENPRRFGDQGDKYIPRAAVQRAVARLEFLCDAFGDLFRRHDVEAAGHPVIPNPTGGTSLGPMGVISPGIWSLERFCLSDLSSEIFEHVVPNTPSGDLIALRWAGVVIRLPVTTAMSPRAAVESAEPLADEQQPMHHGARRRPVAAAVDVALKEVGLDLDRGSLTLEDVAGKIARRMPRPCTTESQIAALVGALKRHYKDVIHKGRAGKVVPVAPRPMVKTHMK